MKFTLISIVVLAAIAVGCAPKDSNNGELDSLRLDRVRLQSERDRLHSEKTELDKRIDRMVRCHKDFQGYMGQRLDRSIKLNRITQRVQRFDCANQMTSDAVETIEAPRAIVELAGIPALADSKNLVTVYNRMTCNSPDKGFYKGGLLNSVVGGSRHPYLWVDRAAAVFTHEVEPGLNLIDLSVCPLEASGCKDPTFLVTVALNVIYEEQNKPEILVVKKNVQDCEAEKKKSL